MANNKNEHSTTDNVVCVLCVSRNKDNNNVENFAQRRKSFLAKADSSKIQREFNHFVQDGVPGELCRLYVSVNCRNVELVQKKLMHAMIDSDLDLTHLESKVCALAALKECALTKYWLVDFDSNDEKELNDLMSEINQIDATIEITKYRTLNGFHLILSHGFDVRQLSKPVDIKRDDMRLADWKTTS